MATLPCLSTVPMLDTARCYGPSMETIMTDAVDFTLIDHGSVCSIVACSDAAREFARENFKTDHRVAHDLIARLASEGWSVHSRQ